MADKFSLPELVRPIPDQNATIGSPYRLDAKEFIQHPLGTREQLIFSAAGESDFPLPRGLSCDENGVLSGVPEKGTYRPQGYALFFKATTSKGRYILVDFRLMIAKSIRLDDPKEPVEESFDLDADFDAAIDMAAAEMDALERRVESEIIDDAEMVRDKQKVWQAILNGDTVPEIQSLLDRDVTYDEVYHLMERFAFLAIWNADDRSSAGKMKRLLLEGASEHFDVYDRGACLVGSPKQLFSHERTLLHGIDTAKAMAREALDRGWKVEFGGFDKLVRAAWVEMEALAEKQNKATGYAHYFPSEQDYELLHQARLKLQ